MNTAICKRTILVVLIPHLASCASGPSPSNVPVVEAGMPAEKRSAGNHPPTPVREHTDSSEPGTAAGFDSEWEQQPMDSPAPLTEPRPTGVAVLALLETADLQRAEGKLAAAAASLERAVRIEPQNPWIWYRLAAVRQQQDRLEQAEELARRADSLAGTDNEVRAAAWRLIAQIRERRGDQAGARRARQRADVLVP